MSEHIESANDALKFLAYSIRAYELEEGEPLEVSNSLLADLIQDQEIVSINLSFEFDAERDRVIIQAVENGTE